MASSLSSTIGFLLQPIVGADGVLSHPGLSVNMCILELVSRQPLFPRVRRLLASALGVGDESKGRESGSWGLDDEKNGGGGGCGELYIDLVFIVSRQKEKWKLYNTETDKPLTRAGDHKTC